MPEDEALQQHLERVCEAAGDYKRVATLLVARAEATADAGSKASLLVRAANVLIDEVGAAPRALAILAEARAVDPESVDAVLAFARASLAVAQPEEAKEALEAFIARGAKGESVPPPRQRVKRGGQLGPLYLALGRAHLAVDELAEAQDALKSGFATDPRNAELAMLLGLVSSDLGDERTAERALLAVVTLSARKDRSGSDVLEEGGSSQSAAALFQLARMAHDRGDRAKARRWVDTAVREDPGHDAARALLERIDGEATGASRENPLGR
jgi:tetratricopeptide (TPR) repeat protein